MILEKQHLYHIYNQGNNRQKIFFERENYLFFLEKFNKLVLPFVDVVAWCLMPNHFHFMLYVKEVELSVDVGDSGSSSSSSSEGFTRSEALTGRDSEALTGSAGGGKARTINDAIGILLRSYTRAINKQENRTGSLFRTPTKAECITKYEKISPAYFNTFFGAQVNVRIPEKEYPQLCFHYIHNNPVVSNIVAKPENWEFSSYRDYVGLRNGKMINKERAKEFVLFR